MSNKSFIMNELTICNKQYIITVIRNDNDPSFNIIDCNGNPTHNQLVRKPICNYLAKVISLAKLFNGH